MRLESIILRFATLERSELIGWIEHGFVRPEPAEAGDWVFQEIDIARVQLLVELRRDMGVPEDTLPLVLSLLDQIYELRAHLSTHVETLARALETQPREVRAALLAAITEKRGC